MTPREQLLETLLVERFGPNQHAMFQAAQRRANDDSDIATARRRRELDVVTKENRRVA